MFLEICQSASVSACLSNMLAHNCLMIFETDIKLLMRSILHVKDAKVFADVFMYIININKVVMQNMLGFVEIFFLQKSA